MCAASLYVYVCCTAGGERASTLLEAVQSGHGAATREGIEAELRLLKLEGEGPAGATQGKVGMHWSEGWCCRHVWDMGQLWY